MDKTVQIWYMTKMNGFTRQYTVLQAQGRDTGVYQPRPLTSQVRTGSSNL